MATYSFEDFSASIVGPSGVIDLGFGAAVAKEGITVSYAQPRNAMTVGADGEVMHSLRADKSGTVTVRLIYVSPTNAKLLNKFNAESLSSSLWGQNVLTIRNKANEEVVTCRSVAFQQIPDKTFAEDGGIVEWVFDCGKIDQISGEYSEG